MLPLLRTCHPTFYDLGAESSVIEKPTLCRACTFLLYVCFVVSIPSSVMLWLRCLPALAEFDPLDMVHAAGRIFPAGLELVMNDTALYLRPAPSVSTQDNTPHHENGQSLVCWTEGSSSWCAAAPQLEPIRIELGWLLWDACHSDLPPPLNVPPVRLYTMLTARRSLLRDEDVSAVVEIEAVNIVEFEVGERVEVKHAHDLASGVRSLAWGGGWVPAVVVSVQPARMVGLYGYVCQLPDGLLVQKRCDHVRRSPAVVLTHGDLLDSETVSQERMSASAHKELLSLHAGMVLMPDSVHLLQGYSFHYAQYWQYKSSTGSAVLTTHRPVSLDALRSYVPFGVVLENLCETAGPQDLVCSANTAARRLQPLRLRAWLPWFSGPAGLQVWLAGLVALIIGWSHTVVFTLPALFIINMPMAYVTTNLLRHVDTPHTPIRTLAVLGAYCATPFILLEESLDQGLAALDVIADVRQGSAPTATNDNEAKSDDDDDESGGGEREDGTGEALGGEEAGSGAGRRANDETGPGQAEEAPMFGSSTFVLATLELAAAVAGCVESVLRWLQDAVRMRTFAHVAFTCFLAARLRFQERTAQRARSATPARSSAARREDGGTEHSADASDTNEEPTCRICFAGSEAGQLVSPCLCSGSMRFVHLDCLTKWRTVSSNPLSYVQCEVIPPALGCTVLALL